MTVVVAFYCSDGVVIAADSMITPTMGQLNVGHHHGRKIHILQGQQLFAFAGDLGQAARVRTIADANHAIPAGAAHALEYPIQLSAMTINQFTATGINNAIGVNALVTFAHGGLHQCAVFEGAMQPRLLDVDHFYVALGSGKLSADPFLRFLADIFCSNGLPNVRNAVLLAIWTVQHVINTNPGGVAGPIKVATFDCQNGVPAAHELTDDEKAEHQQAIESAIGAVKSWRDQMNAPPEQAVAPIPDPPVAPAVIEQDVAGAPAQAPQQAPEPH